MLGVGLNTGCRHSNTRQRKQTRLPYQLGEIMVVGSKDAAWMVQLIRSARYAHNDVAIAVAFGVRASGRRLPHRSPIRRPPSPPRPHATSTRRLADLRLRGRLSRRCWLRQICPPHYCVQCLLSTTKRRDNSQKTCIIVVLLTLVYSSFK